MRKMIAPVDSERCKATARNFPGRKEVARCMRHKTIGCLCAQHAKLKQQVRERVLSHGSTLDTVTGQEYVGCKCRRCESDRKKLIELSGGVS